MGPSLGHCCAVTMDVAAATDVAYCQKTTWPLPKEIKAKG